jgi:hypothetical protein
LALDVVAHRIESGAASAKDIIYVVTLSDNPIFVVEEEPYTWQLYNRLVKIYTKKSVSSANGHGPYIPVFEKVHDLLERSDSSGCPLAVSLLSDGKPSDKMRGGSHESIAKLIADEAAALASLCGSRLTFATIGIGDAHDFQKLEKIVEAVKYFDAHRIFQLPSMTSSELGNAFTSVSTSLTSTQIEQTDLDSIKQHLLWSVLQEFRSKAAIAIKRILEEDFYLYSVARSVERQSYSEYTTPDGRNHLKFSLAEYQHPDTCFVAFAKGPFGEGVERFAYRCYEVAADGATILGKALVAKESRYIENEEISNESERRNFVRTSASHLSSE